MALEREEEVAAALCISNPCSYSWLGSTILTQGMSQDEGGGDQHTWGHREPPQGAAGDSGGEMGARLRARRVHASGAITAPGRLPERDARRRLPPRSVSTN